MENTENKQRFINDRFNELTIAWFLHYVFWGAMLFLILGLLDYIFAPKSLSTLLIFKLSIVYFLLLIYFVFRKMENIKYFYFFAFASIVMSAIAIERMVINLSGDRSMYYTGLILLNVVVITFIPARIWFSIVASCAIYSIYLVPIIVIEKTSTSAAFFVYNLILFAIILSSLFMRYINNKSLTNEFGFSYDIDEYRRNLERLVEERTKELKEALDQVKVLSGFLPICASCKKIRDDRGYWNQIEVYIRDHSDADFSHSICPECFKKLYPDFKYKEKLE